jgi:predicted nucleic acid-binding protein
VLPPLAKIALLADVFNMKEKQIPTDENRRMRAGHLKKRLDRARRMVRKYVPRTVSLVDELIAERRQEARRESDQH